MITKYYTVQIGNDQEHASQFESEDNAISMAIHTAKQNPAKQIQLWKHEYMGEYMSETTHNRDVTITCPKCGATATVHGYGNRTTCYYCPACGMEVPA